jgi:hypothetical protein
MIAALKGFPSMVSLMLERGADPYRAGYDGASALSLAQDLGYPGIVALLNGVLPQ